MMPESFFFFGGGGGRMGATRCIKGVVQMYNNYFCMHALFHIRQDRGSSLQVSRDVQWAVILNSLEAVIKW